MRRRGGLLALGLLGLAVLGPACTGDDERRLNIIDLGDAKPGETVGLIAAEDDGRRYLEWIDRLDGTIRRIDIDAADTGIETLATIPVGTDGEQRGLLGQVVIGGARYASWTQPDTFELVVGVVVDGGPGDIVFSAGAAGGGAIGGVLDDLDGQILLGLGRNTAWDADTGVGGAILTLDPDAGPEQTEHVLSTGYTNPWAFAALDDGDIWVADNAAGPHPDDDARDDVERIGRADVTIVRDSMPEVEWPERAPSAMIELPDGRVGICGFLDNELRAYDIADGAYGPELDRAGTIMPCLTGAAVFSDGSIATIAQTADGMAIHILRP